MLLDGEDIYDAQKKLTEARRQIGMVFQKPNPFPAMSIYDNVVAGLQAHRHQDRRPTRRTRSSRRASPRPGSGPRSATASAAPGGGLSGGQQQRLCIARALAIRPRVLLMDEPCSALDPTSTRRIEETIMELGSEVTIVIVTHNMQQAARVSDQCAFFLAEQGTPGVIVEHGPTEAMFALAAGSAHLRLRERSLRLTGSGGLRGHLRVALGVNSSRERYRFTFEPFDGRTGRSRITTERHRVPFRPRLDRPGDHP